MVLFALAAGDLGGVGFDAGGASDVFVVELLPTLGSWLSGSAQSLGGAGADELVGLSVGRDGGLELVLRTPGGFPVGGNTVARRRSADPARDLRP